MNYPHVQTRSLFVSALIEMMLNYSSIQVCRVRFLYFQIKLCFFSPQYGAHAHSLRQSPATRNIDNCTGCRRHRTKTSRIKKTGVLHATVNCFLLAQRTAAIGTEVSGFKAAALWFNGSLVISTLPSAGPMKGRVCGPCPGWTGLVFEVLSKQPKLHSLKLRQQGALCKWQWCHSFCYRSWGPVTVGTI